MDNIIECPSGLRVKVTNLKMKQLKLLANRKAIEDGEAYDQFLAGCASEVVDPGPAYSARWTPGTVFDWKRALQGDRYMALLGIRRASYPSLFEFDVRCRGCGKEYGWALDLARLPVVKYPEASIEAFVAGRELSMEVAGRTIYFRLMTGAEEERIRNHLARLEKTDRRTRRHPFDPLVDGAIARWSRVTPSDGDLRDWYENLDAEDGLKIGRVLEETAGGVDTTIECVHSENPMCGAATRIELPFGSKDFWMPRRTAPRSDEG